MAADESRSKCLMKFPDGVYRGTKVTLQGSIPADALRFAINLQCGPKPYYQEEMALHLNPRFNEMVVVRTHSTDKWGPEERIGGLPLSKGSEFETVIECNEHALKVSFNGNHFCDFAHRMPYHRITYIWVEGDVILRHVSIPTSENRI